MHGVRGGVVPLGRSCCARDLFRRRGRRRVRREREAAPQKEHCRARLLSAQLHVRHPQPIFYGLQLLHEPNAAESRLILGLSPKHRVVRRLNGLSPKRDEGFNFRRTGRWKQVHLVGLVRVCNVAGNLDAFADYGAII
jgi:hypothetical protein